MPFTLVTTTRIDRLQSLFGLLLFAILVLTGVLLDRLAHYPAIESWVDRKGHDFAEVSRNAFTRDGYYIDDNDRLILEELPSADYRQGGVYFFGTSTVRTATKFWTLPAVQQKLIHNYGISQSDYTCQLMFIRHLIDNEKILQAGADKSLFVFASSYHHLSRRFDSDGFFVNLWKRHGVYNCSQETGIQPVRRNRVWRYLHFRLSRIAGFSTRLIEIGHLEIRRRWHGEAKLAQKLPAETANDLWRQRMGTDWREKIDEGIREFDALVQYLTGKNISISVVLLPIGEAERLLPFHNYYRTAMKSVSDKYKLPFHDWSTKLTEAEMQDTSHPNVFGASKLQSSFLEIAIPFLTATGALPPKAVE